MRIPSALRTLTGGKADIVVSGDTVRGALAALEAQHPGISAKLLDTNGAVRPFIRIYVGPEDIGGLAGLDTSVTDRDEIAIIPAIAGG